MASGSVSIDSFTRVTSQITLKRYFIQHEAMHVNQAYFWGVGGVD